MPNIIVLLVISSTIRYSFISLQKNIAKEKERNQSFLYSYLQIYLQLSAWQALATFLAIVYVYTFVTK